MLRILCILAVVSLSQGQDPASITFGDCRIYDMIEGVIVEGGMGLCVKLPDCPQFAEFMTLEPNEDDLTALQLRKCGEYHGLPLVCCAKPPSFEGDLLPSPGVCGYSLVPRIVGGNETKIQEHRWMALLVYMGPNDELEVSCGGTLISERYVLTAAHCIPSDSWKNDSILTHVRLGEWDLGREEDCEDELCSDDPIDVLIKEIIPHKDYNPKSISKTNDIALLRLSCDVSYSGWITPICLPRLPEVRSASFIGEKMQAVGWGITETGKASFMMMKTELTVHDFGQCSSTYRRHNIDLQSGQMCARGGEGSDVCAGDSGGPLIGFSATEGRPYYFVAGIISMGGNLCGLGEVPGVFTRVGAYMDWIEKTIKH